MGRTESIELAILMLFIGLLGSVFTPELRAFLFVIPQGMRKARIAYLKEMLATWGGGGFIPNITLLADAVCSDIGMVAIVWGASYWLALAIPQLATQALQVAAFLTIFYGLQIRSAASWATNPSRVAQAKATISRLGGVVDDSVDVGCPASEPDIEHPPTFSLVEVSSPSAIGLDVPGNTNHRGGMACYVHNKEDRFDLPAHNLKAFLTMRSFEGEELKIRNAPWFCPRSGHAPAFQDEVTIGMTEFAGVILLIHTNGAFFTAKISDTGVEVDRPLSFGEWHVDLELKGSNFNGSYSTKLKLAKHGGITPFEVQKVS